MRAWAWELRGEPNEVAKYARAAAGEAERRGANHLTARARLSEARALFDSGDAKAAIAALDDAIDRFRKAENRKEVAAAYELKAEEETDLDTARQLLEIARRIYREGGYRNAEAWVLMNLGYRLFENERRDEAETLFAEAMALFDGLGAREDKAAALVNIGASYQMQGDLSKARARYTEALAVFQDLGNELWTAMVLTNIGEILYLAGDLDGARRMHEEALAVNRRLGDEAGVAYDNYRLGMVFVARGDWGRARQRYEGALASQQRLAKQADAAETRLALAELELIEKNFANSEKLARQVVGASDLADKEALAQVLLARTLLAQGRMVDARPFAEAAADAAVESDDQRVHFGAAFVRARLRAAAGEVDGALADLAELATRASAKGRLLDSFEVRLAMGEIELDAGRIDAGRHRLAKLHDDADATGVQGIVRRVEKLLAGRSLAKSPA